MCIGSQKGLKEFIVDIYSFLLIIPTKTLDKIVAQKQLFLILRWKDVHRPHQESCFSHLTLKKKNNKKKSMKKLTETFSYIACIDLGW